MLLAPNQCLPYVYRNVHDFVEGKVHYDVRVAKIWKMENVGTILSSLDNKRPWVSTGATIIIPDASWQIPGGDGNQWTTLLLNNSYINSWIDSLGLMKYMIN